MSIKTIIKVFTTPAVKLIEGRTEEYIGVKHKTQRVEKKGDQ